MSSSSASTPNGSNQEVGQKELSMNIEDVSNVPAHDGGSGQGLLFSTTRGELKGIFHQAEGSNQAVVWVCGQGDIHQRALGNGSK